jgi:hypothetical protein
MKRCNALVGAWAVVLTLACVAAAQETRSLPEFDPGRFVNEVDNKFFPLTPGTTMFYEGESDGVPTSDVFRVTHQKEQILGVDCVVVRDQAYEAGVLVEDTLDWFAQDADGNVWYFGEDSKELDEFGNVISTAGSWRAGENGALPGIIMLADPRKGDRYQQEFAEDVAEDMAQVISVDEAVSVEYGDFEGVLVTREWSPLERGVVEHKYYAEGVGFVLGIMVKGGDEVLELVDVTRNPR